VDDARYTRVRVTHDGSSVVDTGGPAICAAERTKIGHRSIAVAEGVVDARIRARETNHGSSVVDAVGNGASAAKRA